MGQLSERKRIYRRKRKQRKIILTVTAIVVLLILIIAVFIYSKYKMINRSEIDEEKVTNVEIAPEAIEKMKGYTNFAIFGIDSRDNKSLGKGNNSDVIMICSINNETGEIRLVSVYRDTYLDINGKEKFRKINAAYQQGGPQQALLALNQNMDLNLTRYVTFNWKAVADVVNILGGIDLEITEKEYGNGTTTGINGFIQATKEATGIDSMHLQGPGMQHLDGIQAVAYARLRLMDSDFQRTERQRKVIALVLQKAKQADLGMLLDSTDAILPNIMTNIPPLEMTRLISTIPDYHIGATAGFPTRQFPDRMGTKEIYVVPDGLSENVAALHAFLFEHEDYQISSAVSRRDTLIHEKAAADTPKTTSAAQTTSAAPTTTTAATDITTGNDKTTENPGKTTDSTSKSATDDRTSATDGTDQLPDESGTAAILPDETLPPRPTDTEPTAPSDPFPSLNPTVPTASTQPTSATQSTRPTEGITPTGPVETPPTTAAPTIVPPPSTTDPTAPTSPGPGAT